MRNLYGRPTIGNLVKRSSEEGLKLVTKSLVTGASGEGALNKELEGKKQTSNWAHPSSFVEKKKFCFAKQYANDSKTLSQRETKSGARRSAVFSDPPLRATALSRPICVLQPSYRLSMNSSMQASLQAALSSELDNSHCKLSLSLGSQGTKLSVGGDTRLQDAHDDPPFPDKELLPVRQRRSS